MELTTISTRMKENLRGNISTQCMERIMLRSQPSVIFAENTLVVKFKDLLDAKVVLHKDFSSC